MANNYFKFKKFTISQERAAMKVGTDGVLLGAWVAVNGAKSILDVGVGTGLISIMLAQRTDQNCSIEGVEIDAPAYQQAVDNVRNCPWSSRINLYNESFQHFEGQYGRKYDLIVSNPPFFLNGLKANDGARTKARHADDYLPFDELIAGAISLLNTAGRLAVILPLAEGERFVALARIAGFYLRQKVMVTPNPGKPVKRVLLEFSLEEGPLKESHMSVENGARHVYSPQYISLTKDFYLKF